MSPLANARRESPEREVLPQTGQSHLKNARGNLGSDPRVLKARSVLFPYPARQPDHFAGRRDPSPSGAHGVIEIAATGTPKGVEYAVTNVLRFVLPDRAPPTLTPTPTLLTST